MRHSKFIVLAIIIGISAPQANATSMAAYYGFGAPELSGKSSVTINADGSAKYTQETTQTRKEAEQMAKMWSQSLRMRELAETGDIEEIKKLRTETQEAKPLTDAELEKMIRATMDQTEESYGYNRGNLDKVEITTNAVTTTTTKTFASLEEFLSMGGGSWQGMGLNVENIRFESTNSQLRVTLTPYKMPKKYAAQWVRYLKKSAAKTEFHLTLPGKIISSGLPETGDKTTGISIDMSKTNTVEYLLALASSNIVVVAELGGLKLETPVDSKTLMRSVYRPAARIASNIPITDAAEAYTVEAVNVKTRTLYLFPEGEKQAERMPADERSGATVRAKIIAPKSRTIQSVSDVKIVKAIDDKGREVKAPAAEDEMDSYMDSFDYSDIRKKKSANVKAIQLRFELPAADARSIEEVTLEAVVQTVGTWKELTVPLADGKTNEIDLAAVLPGATLSIRKTVIQANQAQLDGVLKGPDEIQQLELELKSESSEDGLRNQPSIGGMMPQRQKGMRRVNLRGYMMMARPGASPPQINLLVRLPTDTKRERVKLNLSGLDLD